RGYRRPEIQAQRDRYRRRRDILIGGLRKAGWPVTSPDATFFVWARCPEGDESDEVAMRLLDEADVVVVPGYGFGETARGFVRFALTVEEVRTAEAVERIAKMSW
ncbi:MAG: aminotransferase class I/II-fold pyridoxal phosphate-dependent enzyme, partial [Phycisphaerae bacterium]